MNIKYIIFYLSFTDGGVIPVEKDKEFGMGTYRVYIEYPGSNIGQAV